jgi:hypothetical protein
MNAGFQCLSGVVAAASVAAVSEVVPDGDTVLLVSVAAVSVIAAVFGKRLPLVVKVFATSVIFYFGYCMCLVGHTEEPGLTGQTVGRALLYFVLFATVPLLSLARVWHRRIAIIVMTSAFPLGITGAAVVARIEEHQFVQKYRETGVGPTSRWTVSNHWLSYDREAQRLDGSD